MKFPSRLVAYGSAGVAATAAYRTILAPRVRTWGATTEDVLRAMPGDDLVPNPMFQATHAITIDAPPEDIWPWLVQLGYGRAGFYSYEWIERSMGLAGIHNTDRILPEFQQLKVGDVVPFGPGGGPGKEVGLTVIALQRNHELCLSTRDDHGVVTWAFGLYPIDDQHTRLVSRNLAYMPEWTLNNIVRHPARWRTELPMKLFINLGALVMVRRMLIGIKRRAEGTRASEVAEEQALVLSSGCE